MVRHIGGVRLRPLVRRASALLVVWASYSALVYGCIQGGAGWRSSKGRLGAEWEAAARETTNRRVTLAASAPGHSVTTDTEANCTDPAILDFPTDLFSADQRKAGAIALHVFLAFYLFVTIAIVCDNYFVPAIGKIAKNLHMPKDVAGATFMAVATSSPELFINSVGTFVTEGDLGIGTIVGSAVFNILAVPACCGLFAGKCLHLDWWPLTRDSLAYGISIILLILTLADEIISWQEAFLLVAAYFMYILIMCYNEAVKKCIESCINRILSRNPEGTPLLAEDISLRSEGHVISGGVELDTGSSNSGDLLSQYEDDEELNLWRWPSGSIGVAAKVWWLLVWPVSLLLHFTVPDCRQPHRHRLYPLTFAMCIVYIGCASYLVAWMITVIGDTARIPDSVMGLTFLAAGTSLPEALSSVIVSNKGFGSMGLCSSLGSNTFDILICLGLPWLIKSAWLPATPEEHFVTINSKGIEYSAISLLLTLLILYILFVLNQFKLDGKIGLVCLLSYITFLVVATLNELNFFFDVNLPTCGW